MFNLPSIGQSQTQFLKEFVRAYSTGPSRAFLRSYEADLFSKIPLEPPTLDLACGDGLVSALTFGGVLDCGCDLMMSQLKKAKALGQYKTLVLADARELPYEDATFKSVISNSSIEHIPRVEEVLKEVFRVLKPNGLLFFTVPGPRFNDWFWKNWFWTRLRKPERGLKSIEDFNQLREHHNIYDAGQWNQLLIKSGFSCSWSKEYFPFRATFVFSILENLWNISIILPWKHLDGLNGKRINLAGGSLLLLPGSIRINLQTQVLSLFSRQCSLEQGSHLLFAARK